MVFCKILIKKAILIKEDKAEGFTITELLVALSLLAVLCAFVYPQFSTFQNKLALKQAANQLAADIRYIKQKAIAHQGASNNYILLEADKYNIIVNGAIEREVDLKELYGTRVAIKGISYARNKIQFNYFGNAAGVGGHVMLQNKDGNKLYVIVYPIMGRVRIDTQAP